MGMLNVPLPVTELDENFSPIPRMAPPPFGSEIVGAATRNVSGAGGTFVDAALAGDLSNAPPLVSPGSPRRGAIGCAPRFASLPVPTSRRRLQSGVMCLHATRRKCCPRNYRPSVAYPSLRVHPA